MHVRRLSLLVVGLAAVLGLVACSAQPAGGEPTGTPSMAPPSATAQPPSVAPTSAPTTFAPIPSPSPQVQSGASSAAQAAALVFASNPLFGSIKPLDAASVGQSASYTASESGDGYAVSITLGSGDCPSSCINTHTWNYQVARDGTMTLESEQGDPVEVSIDHGTADLATVAILLVAGPVCPVEKPSPDPGCEPRPVSDAEVVLRDPTGKEVARATSGAGGEVDFFVPGGAYYAESAAVEGLMGQAEPEAFSVPGGRSVTIALEYDTGIR